ncbi:unnamed protein product [Adineta steineri]|uniref:Uncharacterized protein n=1 Tax=Adineta steineri TaxID=433720 RepID=A0A819SRN1_9BILA|nr:unnamed protein product [Adineta steineri]CAF4065564.1 unnamed protein product [Adineta steineri]
MYSYWDETYFKFDSNILNNYENPLSFHFNNNTKHDSAAMLLLLKNSYKRFLYVAAKYTPAEGHDFMPLTCAVCS